MAKQTDVDAQIGAIEGLLDGLENALDPDLRDSAKELVQALMRLHGTCLERDARYRRSDWSSGATHHR